MNQARTSLWFISAAVIIIFFSLVALSFADNEPWSFGDGWEYVLQTAAIQNHLSFGIAIEDLFLAQEQFPSVKDSLGAAYKSLAVGNDGLSYSNHFGMYSLLVVPIKLILLASNIDAIYAFRITNCLLWLLAAFIVLFCLKADDRIRIGVLILVLFNPAFFYITWVHAELYLFSFSVIGLVFYYNKKYSLGILFVSIAAMQNLGLLPLCMAIGIQFIWEEYIGYSENNGKSVLKFIKRDGIKIISYGVFFIPAIIPMITCYVHFGVINRVAEVAMEDKYLFSKMIDYLIDLNLGILPYEPIVLILFVVLIIKGIINKSVTAVVNLFAVSGMLFIISFELQINCGMEGIMRYNVWIIPCMVFFVAINLAVCEFWTYILIVCGEALFTSFVVIITLWGTTTYHSCEQFAPWTEFVLDRFPQLYNPSHGIFYTRASGGELYHSSYPLSWRNENGYVRKILLSKEAINVFEGDSYLLYGNSGNLVSKDDLKLLPIDNSEYFYVNMHGDVKDVYSYEVGRNKIYFDSSKYNAELYVKKGIGTREFWGSWTEGKSLILELYINDKNVDHLRCMIDVAMTFYQPQTIRISANGEEVYNNKISGEQIIEFDFVKTNNIVVLSFDFPDSVKPSAVLASTDNRELGIGLRSIVISESGAN